MRVRVRARVRVRVRVRVSVSVRVRVRVRVRVSNGVAPALVEEDEEDRVVSQAGDAVRGGHGHLARVRC